MARMINIALHLLWTHGKTMKLSHKVKLRYESSNEVKDCIEGYN